MAAHRRWVRERPSVQDFQVIAVPSSSALADPAPGVRTIRRSRFTFLVSPR